MVIRKWSTMVLGLLLMTAMIMAAEPVAADTRCASGSSSGMKTRQDGLRDDRGLRIVYVHPKVTGMSVVEYGGQGRNFFSGKPTVGRVINTRGAGSVMITVRTNGMGGCVLKYQMIK